LSIERITAIARPKVVAIDDQPDSLLLLQLRLKSAGIDCAMVSDPSQAIARIIADSPDAIILDIMMPVIDGFELCKRLKENEVTSDIPVIFLTASNKSAEIIRAMELGAHDFLCKPVNQQELIARTRSAIRVKKLQDQLKQQIQNEHHFQELQKQKLSEHWQMTFSQLAESLAHEINNPLAAALGIIQLMSVDSKATDEQHQRLVSVADCLYRVSRKMNSLLQIAQTKVEPQQIELAALLDDLAVLANFTVASNNVVLTMELKVNGVWQGILSDWARALWYILNNAIEAVSGQENAIVVLSAFQSEARGGILVSISDNGMGIPKSLQSRVFEPFFTTKGPPHNGIGLYLASEILKKAGSSVFFESPCDKFSTRFNILLPSDTIVNPHRPNH
jgi:DNA-binding response OmpR family regulator